MEKLTLNVEGMTCSHCEARVTKALSEVNGVKSAVVSLDEGTAIVEFEKGQVTEDALIDAVEEAGYEVA
ncbi:heavy-metal-associated domain-containing protein [Listeria monocytogenes]|uniref:copper chaperone CopZ n=1 Tax=Listeria monocytogenes TaxID=1639 RepID=UPI00087554FD|nr:copper chaperone CopZ [Listeria monocytogenes]EAE1298928.1 copper chaperone [Listeria monocytogenes]EAF1496848.1 copper chaperone [Listeria monocytogenes]ECL1978049.1 heavy-metal-associated domain-containing protein [Listeria monocytogenes]EDN9856288.1 copper ion binding protein [Listeria monocytogenes]EGX9245765.1 heavy-metal-associated domain-containing protein [Listeria monocytogenes]